MSYCFNNFRGLERQQIEKIIITRHVSAYRVCLTYLTVDKICILYILYLYYKNIFLNYMNIRVMYIIYKLSNYSNVNIHIIIFHMKVALFYNLLK